MALAEKLSAKRFDRRYEPLYRYSTFTYVIELLREKDTSDKKIHEKILEIVKERKTYKKITEAVLYNDLSDVVRHFFGRGIPTRIKLEPQPYYLELAEKGSLELVEQTCLESDVSKQERQKIEQEWKDRGYYPFISAPTGLSGNPISISDEINLESIILTFFHEATHNYYDAFCLPISYNDTTESRKLEDGAASIIELAFTKEFLESLPIKCRLYVALKRGINERKRSRLMFKEMYSGLKQIINDRRLDDVELYLEKTCNEIRAKYGFAAQPISLADVIGCGFYLGDASVAENLETLLNGSATYMSFVNNVGFMYAVSELEKAVEQQKQLSSLSDVYLNEISALLYGELHSILHKKKPWIDKLNDARIRFLDTGLVYDELLKRGQKQIALKTAARINTLAEETENDKRCKKTVMYTQIYLKKMAYSQMWLVKYTTAGDKNVNL